MEPAGAKTTLGVCDTVSNYLFTSPAQGSCSEGEGGKELHIQGRGEESGHGRIYENFLVEVHFLNVTL